MGTTLSCCVIHNGRLIFAHVGDSRIYQLRGGLKQLTQDHSLRSQLIASGQLESSKAHEFPKKNVITKAVGTTKNLEPDTGSCAIEAGDLYLLCSDGLTDMLSNDEIEQILTQFPLPSEAGPSLIAAAKEKGGTDNITALLVKAIL
jgi:serine/threonine protein phosphatase PrpC